MIKLVSSIALAATIAAVITVLPGLVITDVEASAPAPVVKGDRLDIQARGADCSQRGWPYFETSCLRDPQHSGRARAVRVVSTDRLSLSQGK